MTPYKTRAPKVKAVPFLLDVHSSLIGSQALTFSTGQASSGQILSALGNRRQLVGGALIQFHDQPFGVTLAGLDGGDIYHALTDGRLIFSCYQVV